MKNHQFSLVIISLLILSNLLVWTQYRVKAHELMSEKSIAQSSYEQLLGNYKETRTAWAVSASSEVSVLPEQCLKEIGMKKALVVRISDQHCSTCVDQLLFRIKKYISLIGPEQLYVVFSKHEANQMQLKKRVRLIKPIKFIEISEDLTLTSLDQFNIPYLFIAREGHITKCYMPFPVNEQHTTTYLDNFVHNLNH